MLKGFEKQTSPLSTYEKNTLLPIMVGGLKTKIGKDKAITNSEICETLTSKGYDVKEPRVRKLINHITTHHLVPLLIATSKGYWVSDSIQEVEDWIASMDSRIDSLRASKASVVKELSLLKQSKSIRPQGVQTAIPDEVEDEKIYCKCDNPYPYYDVCGECGYNLKE